MCPNETIHRLLDLVSKSIPHITHEETLKEIISELEDLKTRLERESVDN